MVKKQLLLLLVLIAVAGLVTGCFGIGQTGEMEMISASGNVITEEREVSGFSSVVLDGGGQVMIDQNGSEGLTITADEAFMPYIETEVRGDQLVISIRRGTMFNNFSNLVYEISAAQLDSVELNGGGEIQVNNLDTQDWRATLSGGGNIAVDGTTDTQVVEINGAGGYMAENLDSRVATVTHNGAGLAVVRVSDELNATIDGIGAVEYIGSPQVTEEINGLGTVRQRGS